MDITARHLHRLRGASALSRPLRLDGRAAIVAALLLSAAIGSLAGCDQRRDTIDSLRAQALLARDLSDSPAEYRREMHRIRRRAVAIGVDPNLIDPR